MKLRDAITGGFKFPGQKAVMSTDVSLKIDTPAESIEALAKEAETLKAKLEEERQKLNDVARMFIFKKNYRRNGELTHVFYQCQPWLKG